jgi:hypothetical protein
VILTAVKPLKRLTSFGEATYFVVSSADNGTLAPLFDRTKILSKSSGFMR